MLAHIYDEYLANRLDDEARRFYGVVRSEAEDRPAAEIALYTGRGGGTLLTLQHCKDAFDAREKLT